MDQVYQAAAALRRARKRVQEADAALRQAVDQERAQGASWADIGRELGITRQSAQQRFGRVTVPRPEPQPPEPTLTRQQRRALARKNGAPR